MNHLIQLDPFADTAFDNLFRGVFRPLRAEPAPAPIKLDVAEQNGTYVVRAEIPGVGKDEIDVSIEGNQVTIGAEVKRETKRRQGRPARAALRALFRQRPPDLHAAGRDRRGRRARRSTKTACSSSRSRRRRRRPAAS